MEERRQPVDLSIRHLVQFRGGGISGQGSVFGKDVYHSHNPGAISHGANAEQNIAPRLKVLTAQ